MMVQCNVSRFARNMTLLMNLYITYNKMCNEIYLYSERNIYTHTYIMKFPIRSIYNEIYIFYVMKFMYNENIYKKYIS